MSVLRKLEPRTDSTAPIRGYGSPLSRGCEQTKRPGLFDRAFCYFDQRSRLRRFIGDGGIVAVGIDVALGISVRLGFGLGLGAAARALGELAFDFLDCLGLGDMLHHRDFPRQSIERRLIELTFALGLFGLRFRAIA